MGSAELTRLRELSKLLPDDLPPLPTSFPNGNHTRVDVREGSAVGYHILDQPEITVISWRFEAGTRFQAHSHSELEILVVSRGLIKLGMVDDFDRLDKDDEGFYLVGPSDHIEIKPNCPHEAFFPVYTEAVSVHIPRSADYTRCQETETEAPSESGKNSF